MTGLLLTGCGVSRNIANDGAPLTEEEKTADFRYFFRTMLDGNPAIGEYGELYGFSFAERKAFYENSVLQTKDDYEFYCVMSAIGLEIPSFHTDLVEPDPAVYRSLHCYNRREVDRREILEGCERWQTLIREGAEPYKEDGFFVFSYVDGEYVLNRIYSTQPEIKEAAVLISVDGVPADSFITEHLFLSGLHYDGANEKIYRSSLIFGDTHGEDVVLRVKTMGGEISEINAKLSLYAAEAFLYDRVSDELSDPLMSYECREYAYLRIDSFSPATAEYTSAFLSDCENDNVIIDLRECYGGKTDYAAKNIYPYLYADSLCFRKHWYIPKTEVNTPLTRGLVNRIMLKLRSAEDCPYSAQSKYLQSEIETEYTGKRSADRTVYLLCGRGTGSAADTFTAILKDRQLACVIGNNTGGEGLMNSYMVRLCPNSGLAFVYMPGGAKNADGTDNSVYGTAPDVYVNQSAEDFLRMMQFEENGETVSDPDRLLQVDTVLRKAVEMIRQDDSSMD